MEEDIEDVDQPLGAEEEESKSLDIPHMILGGSFKDGSKEPIHACVPRFCTLSINRLQFFGPPPPSFVITIGMEKGRKTLSTAEVILKEPHDTVMNSDLRFGFQYMHSLKPPFDKLRIMIVQVQKKKKRPDQVLGIATINLNRVMQSSLEDEDITLLSPSPVKKKTDKKVEKRDAKDTRVAKKEEDNKQIKDEKKDKEVETIEIAPKPYAQVSVACALYPDDVDSYQDAQEWDEEFMDTLIGEPRTFMSSDEEEYESEDSNSEEDELPPQSPTITSKGTDAISPLPLSELMRSRYKLPTAKKQKGPSKLNIRRYLKQINKKNPKAQDNDDDAPIFGHEEHSLGSSSASSEEEDFLSPPDSPPSRKHPFTNPISIRSPVGTLPTETPPASPTVRSHGPLNSSGPHEDSTLVVFVDTQKRRGRRMEEILKEVPLLHGKVMSTKNSNDIAPVMTSLVSKQQRNTNPDTEATDPINMTPVRVVICGGDTYVNSVLRPFVEICGKKPRGWQAFSFYVIPIGKKNDIAMHIASVDPTYRQIFFTGDWREELLEKQDELSEAEAKGIVSKVFRYLDEANTKHEFPIAEALLSFPHSTNSNSPAVQKNIPFIKGLQLGSRDNSEDPELDKVDTTDLQLDYWYTKKKGEGHKEVKSFTFAAITRLPAVANALHIEPEFKPTPSTFSMLVLIKDKSKMEKMKEALQHFGKKKKEEDFFPISAKINRMTCSSAADNIEFRVLIDGVEWSGVTFVSVSPQWHSHIKSFPVQIFQAKPVIIPTLVRSSSITT